VGWGNYRREMLDADCLKSNSAEQREREQLEGRRRRRRIGREREMRAKGRK
jgi:hypothetical protein